MFTVHFYDDYGYGAFNVETREEMRQAVSNLHNDPTVEEVWTTDDSHEE